MRVVVNSIDLVRSIISISRLWCTLPLAYCDTRFFKERALPT